MPSLPNIGSYGCESNATVTATADVVATVTSTETSTVTATADVVATVTSTETSTVNQNVYVKNIDAVSVDADLVSATVLVINGNTVDVAAIEDSLSSLNNRVDVVEGDVIALDGRLDTAEASIGTLQGQMTTANANISTLQGQMTTANTNISTLQGQMTTANTDIATLQTKTQNVTATSGVTTLTGDMYMGTYLGNLYPRVRSTRVSLPSTSSITNIPTWATRISISVTGAGWSSSYQPRFTFLNPAVSLTFSVAGCVTGINTSAITASLTGGNAMTWPAAIATQANHNAFATLMYLGPNTLGNNHYHLSGNACFPSVSSASSVFNAMVTGSGVSTITDITYAGATSGWMVISWE